MAKRSHDPDIVKTRLKELRKEKGLTQLEVATAIHFSVSTIKQYENGYRVPDSINLHTLAKFYGVQENYILGLSKHRHRTSEWFSTISKEQLADSKIEIAVHNAICLIGNHYFGIDPSDTDRLHALDVYIRLYPEFINEYEQWKERKE